MAAIAIVLASLAISVSVQADARSEYLVRLLQTSTAFRVRAQAALSLGRVTPDATVIAALARALRDENTAVRTSAAASLQQLNDPTALTALRAVRNDSDTNVRRAIAAAITRLEATQRTAARTPATNPSTTGTSNPSTATGSTGPARYYVGVGMPGTKVSQVGQTVLRSARDFIASRVQSTDGVVVAPEGEAAAAATRVLRSRNLTGFYVDSSIVQIEERGGGVRAVVSVIIGTYPGRDMRAMLQGAATVSGGGNAAELQQQAIEGALQGALRRLPEALASARGDGG